MNRIIILLSLMFCLIAVCGVSVAESSSHSEKNDFKYNNLHLGDLNKVNINSTLKENQYVFKWDFSEKTKHHYKTVQVAYHKVLMQGFDTGEVIGKIKVDTTVLSLGNNTAKFKQNITDFDSDAPIFQRNDSWSFDNVSEAPDTREILDVVFTLPGDELKFDESCRKEYISSETVMGWDIQLKSSISYHFCGYVELDNKQYCLIKFRYRRNNLEKFSEKMLVKVDNTGYSLFDPENGMVVFGEYVFSSVIKNKKDIDVKIIQEGYSCTKLDSISIKLKYPTQKKEQDSENSETAKEDDKGSKLRKELNKVNEKLARMYLYLIHQAEHTYYINNDKFASLDMLIKENDLTSKIHEEMEKFYEIKEVKLSESEFEFLLSPLEKGLKAYRINTIGFIEIEGDLKQEGEDEYKERIEMGARNYITSISNGEELFFLKNNRYATLEELIKETCLVTEMPAGLKKHYKIMEVKVPEEKNKFPFIEEKYKFQMIALEKGYKSFKTGIGGVIEEFNKQD